MNTSGKTIGLVLLGALALGLRIWVVFALSGDYARPVAYEHGTIAENLLAGRGFSIELLGREGSTSQQAPFYPLLLAAAYAVFGVATPGSILAVQLLQAVAGTGLVLAVAWLAWSFLPDRPAAGWLAGLGAAVYPTHVYMVTHLQVAVWVALSLTLLLAVAVSPRWRASTGGAVLAGVLAGLLLLIEPILALALPIVALAYWIGIQSSLSLRERVRVRAIRPRGISPHPSPLAVGKAVSPVARTLVMAAVAAAMIAPWTVRNRVVHGRWIFIKSTFGYALWQGNNPASWGTDKIPKPSAELARLQNDGTLRDIDRAMQEARHETIYIDDVVLKPTGYVEFAGLSEPDRCDLLGRKAMAFIRENPARYARLCFNRLRYFLLFDETNPKAANWLYRIATSVWLVLSVVGLLASWVWWRRLWPTYAIFAAATLFHTLVITSVRFRIPIEPLSFVWIAAALAPLTVHFRSRRRTQTAPPEPPAARGTGSKHILRGPHWRVRSGRQAARR